MGGGGFRLTLPRHCYVKSCAAVKKRFALQLIAQSCIFLVLEQLASSQLPDQKADYGIISKRNVFGLKAPPPAAVSSTPAPARTKITITGITTILGDKRVLLKSSPPPANPGEPTRLERSLILSEGQSEGDLEIVKVDEAANIVIVKNAGLLQSLKLQEYPGTGAASVGPPPPPAALPVPVGAFAYRD